ncbi:endoplasmic reticulum-Golgi intermediate compartment protein 3 [Agrilus planipennis]|uniref:Endoplasmic reticulum-Golgi intermediate compartment protein 3 n=1 Tax=Agrilus planipennis TaxID=224129 RepID=A0A1W4X3F5_AGRPL|nr:endoplasmic reticulum-Golgi intermediate compartment protein 3 [Agrilus planipennis]
MSQLLDKLRKFDAYPKTLEDFRIKTYGGAAVTIISVTIIILLFWTELNDYLKPNVREDLFVDTSRNPNLQINLDIVVPGISCSFLSLDAMDSSGEQHLQIQHNIYKRRLDLKGNPIQEPVKEEITVRVKEETTIKATNESVKCGSCYGAKEGCCNTCSEVREAYREKRWAFPENPESIEQCKGENASEVTKEALNEGCQIYGTLVVNRVAGRFHIAPGSSFSINHIHVHNIQPLASSSFNASHKINSLTFGTNIDGQAHDPLKNTFAIAKEGATMFQYYIKIVPTQYVKKDGSIIWSNQYSVTKHHKVISVMSGESGMPGAFFEYELSPLMVKYTENERSFGHFMTNLCAIIGGVYTVAGLIDSLFYNSMRILKKIELGKLH